MTDVPLRDHMDARWAAHMREHDHMTVAIDTARVEINRRLAEMNELRAQIQSERGEYLSRNEYEAKHEALIQRINSMERSRANLEGRLWAIGAAVVLIQLVIRFIPGIGG